MAGRSTKSSEHWQDEPEAQDYPAAENYLSLLVGRPVADKLAKALRKEIALEHFAAKDILRASGLALLAADDSEVAGRLRQGQEGQKLSPVLLVQGEPLWVADGYHRICASYHLDEKVPVPLPDRGGQRRSGQSAAVTPPQAHRLSRPAGGCGGPSGATSDRPMRPGRQLTPSVPSAACEPLSPPPGPRST